MMLKIRPLFYESKIILLKKSRSKSFSFDNATERDFDRSGKYGLLHSMNEVRVPWIVDSFKYKNKNIRKEFHDIKILDVGCGGGILSSALAGLGFDVTGIDSSTKMIEIAKNRALKSNNNGENLRYEITTPDEFEFTSKDKFDAVIASEVLEHVENVPQFVFNCCNLTKENGFVFFTTINRTLLSLLLAKFAAEYIIRVVPAGVHKWSMFVNPKDLETYLLSYGVKDIKTIGISFNPINRAFSRNTHTKINYGMRGTKTAEVPIYDPQAFKYS